MSETEVCFLIEKVGILSDVVSFIFRGETPSLVVMIIEGVTGFLESFSGARDNIT